MFLFFSSVFFFLSSSLFSQNTKKKASLDWKPLFDHGHRGATLEVTGTLIHSPAAGQPIELIVQSFKCLGPIPDPGSYFMSGKGFLSRELLRAIPHQRHHTKLFTAIQIIKQTAYWAYHEAMHDLGIGEIQPTLISGNECEEGAHPFTVTTILDGKTKPSEISVTPTGELDFSQDFFSKRAFLTVSSQLHLEATILGTKRDGYCMTTAFRAEPSRGPLHLAEFLMPEWEVIGGGLNRNMAVAQYTLKHMFGKVLHDCRAELEFLEAYRKEDDKEHIKTMDNEIKEKKKGLKEKTITKEEITKLNAAKEAEQKRREGLPSVLDRLILYVKEPFAITTHEECVRLMLADIAAGKVKFDAQPGYGEDLSRQHEYYISETLFKGRPTFVRYFPKKIKAFYMPVIKEDTEASRSGIEHVEGYDLIFPFVGEVVGGSQRIHNEAELKGRMTELGMNLETLQWYIDLRRDATLPHGGAGLGFGRAMVVMTGLLNIKDMQEFPRACGLSLFA